MLLNFTRFYLFPLLLITGGAIADSRKEGAVHIVTTLAPIELIVRELVPDSVSSEYLIDSGTQAHDFSLKVSHIQAIATADLFIWVGPGLEGGLAQAAGKAKSVLQLQAVENDDHHGEASHHKHDHGSEGAVTDWHIWLTPQNAVDLSKKIASALIELDGIDKLELARNQAEFIKKMDKQERLMVKQLSPFSTVPYIAYHHGYSRFVEAFNLNQVASVTLVPDQQVAVKQLVQLKKQASHARCILADPSEIHKAQAYGKKLGLRPVAINLLEGRPQIASYSAYLDKITQSFITCLQK